MDLAPTAKAREAAIGVWRAELDRVFGNNEPATPAGRGLQPLVATFDLPARISTRSWMALRWTRPRDVTRRSRISNRTATAWRRRSGSCAFASSATTIRVVRDYARDLGVALQLTNILRDVGVDFRRGRVYLPIEDLTRFGCTDADIEREVKRSRPRRSK